MRDPADDKAKAIGRVRAIVHESVTGHRAVIGFAEDGSAVLSIRCVRCPQFFYDQPHAKG